MDEIEKAAAAYKRAEQRADLTRKTLRTLIREARENGTSSTELVRKTGFSREQIRRIARGIYT